MESNSVLSLEKKLRSRTADQTEIAEKIVNTEFKRLNSRLKELSEAELSTILRDMEDQVATMRRYLKFGWLKTAALILAVLLGTGAGSWGYTKFLTYRIQSLQEQYSQSKIDLEKLGRLSVTVAGNQIHFLRKPNLWRSQNGIWVIEMEK